MHRTAALILAVALLAALPGCDVGLPDDVAARDYVHREARFALDVPQGWQVRESRGAVTAFVLAPESADGRANVTVTVESAGRFSTAGALARAADRRLGRLTGITHHGSEERTLADGTETVVTTFEHRAAGDAVRQQQLYVLAGGKAYTVTATAAPPEAFAAYEPAFEKVFRSFRAAW
ncbi:MAG: PsbP-related protein [Phycisphaerae bacterium]